MKNLVKYLLALAVLGSFLAYLFIGKSQAQFSIRPVGDTGKPYIFGSDTGQKIAPIPVPVQLDEHIIYELVNTERSKQKLKELRFDPSLCEYAESRLDQIKVSFSHDGFDQTSQKYLRENRLNRLGENLAMGYSTEIDTVANWMNSPTHKENILRRVYTDTCVRCDKQFCVQIFAEK